MLGWILVDLAGTRWNPSFCAHFLREHVRVLRVWTNFFPINIFQNIATTEVKPVESYKTYFTPKKIIKIVSNEILQ